MGALHACRRDRRGGRKRPRDALGRSWQLRKKGNADHAALRVHGVRSLASNLRVTLGETELRDYDEILRAVQTVLAWAVALSGCHIGVHVEDGWVTLAGTVKWRYQRLEAIDGVRHLAVVTDVSNGILVEAWLSAHIVKPTSRRPVATRWSPGRNGPWPSRTPR